MRGQARVVALFEHRAVAFLSHKIFLFLLREGSSQEARGSLDACTCSVPSSGAAR
jgi:hypothetical protein